MQLSDWIDHDLAELQTTLRGVSPVEQAHLGEVILQTDRLFVVGQGRTGLVIKMFAMRLMQIGLDVHIVGEVLTPAIRHGNLLIAASGSGETSGVVRAAQKSRDVGAQVAAITARADSSLARVANHLTCIPGESIKVTSQVSTRLPLANALEQSLLIFLDCIVAWLATERGETNQTMMSRHANLE